MATKPFIAEKGLMTQVLGSVAVLALAAPLTDGDRDAAALTHDTRMGFYWDRTAAAEKIGAVVMGTESFSITEAGITLPVGAGVGKVLTSDANGVATWTAAAGAIGGSITATQVAYGAATANQIAGNNGIVMDATNRRLGVSDSTALFVPLATLHLSRNGNTGLRADTYSATPTATAGVQLYRARGTAAAPTAIQANDVMGFVGVYGYYATGGTPTGFSSTSRAKIEFLASNTWSNTSQGASVGLWTTAVGSVAATERVRLYADGGMQIGGTGANWGTSPGNGVLAIMQNQYIAPLTGTVLQVVGSNNVKTRIEAVATQTAGGAQTAYATFTGRTSRGPLANPTASLANDILVAISACGYGTTAWPTSNKGLIHVNAAEAWTDAAQGTYIGFDTTAVGGTATSEKVRIWGDGGVQIGGTLTASPGVGSIQVENDMIQASATGAQYMGPPGTDGTWKFVRSGNDLLIQRRESGAYVTKLTVEA